MKVYIMKRNSFKIRISAALTAFITAVNFAAPAFTDINVPGQLITYAAEQGSVNTDRLNVRSGPGTSYGKVATLGAGTKVTVNSETTGNDGYKWYSISFTGGSGYARYDYITKNATYAGQSADFESYLNAQGFPESYKNALRGLHQKYPNWVFEAQQTGLDWNTVVSEESKIGRNLVANTSISSWKSLSAGAFDWASNYWPGFDGATWVQASQDLISYYLDPRNFLTDPYVFQFEIQKYDPSTQTKEGLNSLIKGTFLEGEAIVPIAGSVIEGGTVIEGSTYNPSAAGSVSGSSSSSSTSSSGSAVIGPGGPGANVIIGNGVVTGSGSGSNVIGPYKIGEIADKLTGVINAYAGTWKHTGDAGSYTWYYADDNGQNYNDGWHWIDGNNDGIAECYYFYQDGRMASSTVVDGYTVDAEGKWLGDDGSIQTKAVEKKSQGGELKKVSYADIIMYAAKESNVSPYVIASTILQEQGSGKSSLISGTNGTYPGYYNFFNTGAYEHDGMTAVTAGLKYAKEKGWNTIEKSIIGGAENYGINYVNNGQDTYYLKKFNVQGSNKFNHQYMTHVLAAASEGAKVSNAYGTAFKSTALRFKIPVYSNMPESTSLPSRDGNPNNKLSALTVDGYTLTPTFSMDTTEYSLIVDAGQTSVNVNANTIDSHATASGTGNIALNTGLNTLTITVKAQNGSERNYTINITRKEGSSGDSDTSTVQTGGPGQITAPSSNSGSNVIISGGVQQSSSSAVIIGQAPQ